MLDQDQRTAILQLARQGHGIRTIARLVGTSRNAVRRVLRSGQAEVPALEREVALAPHLERIRELYATCEGNRVRVIEELAAQGVSVAYPTLTRFCRQHDIGVTPKVRVGRYHFEPGQEMQHDTSPHTVLVAGRRWLLQCASLVLCFSRRIFAQLYPRWSRFECKLFLTEALQDFGGAGDQCMLDNSSVIIIGGVGPTAVAAPEMVAFAQRFGFHFAAHLPGDANRSARVERPFHHIEHNFYPGRSFTSLADLNVQLRAWCDQVNQRPKRALGGQRPNDLLALERPSLHPLPPYIPEVYEQHTRRVDQEGYVNLHTNRYSVPTEWIGRALDVRETKDQVRLFAGRRLVATHARQERGAHQRVTLSEHLGAPRWKRHPRPPLPEEAPLRAAAPELARLVDELQRRQGGRAARSLRQLYRLFLDYPCEVITPAVAEALDYGLVDLGRIERMILRRLAGDFFRLPTDPHHEVSDG
ncbi:MAG: IS21 family transposase [Acidobacteriota bacterium]